MENGFFKQKSVPTVFEDGRKGFTIILDDITAHILAERKIRESEQRFRMMAENIHDGLIILENNKVVFVNRRIAEITGYSFEELWAMHPLSIISPEDREAAACQIQNLEKGDDGLKELQIWIVRKDRQSPVCVSPYLCRATRRYPLRIYYPDRYHGN